MTRILIVLGALVVSGCAASSSQTVTDTYCLSPASKKRIWNPETDSVESMREAVTINRYTDLRCGVPGKKAR